MARGWTLLLTGMLAALAVAVSSCGDDGGTGSGSQADRAFLEAMVPHHESAIAMARVARRRAEHPQITELAQAIVTAQSREIRQLEVIYRRLFGDPLLPNEDAHESLGLSAEEAGMGHMESVADLKRAEPFDKAFLDEMVPHHQGAIRMARAVRNQTEDDEIRSLADAIDAAQSKEIAQMSRWREAWYGVPSPAGTLPPESGPGDESMGGHEGH